MRTIACLVILALIGCNNDGTTSVSGKVLVDGQPLEQGDIIFEEADQSKPPVSSTISQGEYKAEMPPGNKKVRVMASRPAGQVDPLMGVAGRESAISPEFNVNSTLTLKVGATPVADANFEVKAAPKK